MARVLFLGAFILTFKLSAISWFPGSVVLASGDVVVGEIARQSDDLILVRSAGEILVLAAHRVQSFRFHDADANINRKFVAMQTGEVFAGYTFLETVASGALTVLRKQRKFSESLQEHDANEFELYVFSGGELVSLKKFRSKYYTFVKLGLEHAGVDTSALNPNDPADAMRMILLFNQLTATPAVAAM